MAVVAQLVEPSVVIRVVAGSSPVDRPIFLKRSYVMSLLHNNALDPRTRDSLNEQREALRGSRPVDRPIFLIKRTVL